MPVGVVLAGVVPVAPVGAVLVVLVGALPVGVLLVGMVLGDAPAAAGPDTSAPIASTLTALNAHKRIRRRVAARRRGGRAICPVWIWVAMSLDTVGLSGRGRERSRRESSRRSKHDWLGRRAPQDRSALKPRLTRAVAHLLPATASHSLHMTAAHAKCVTASRAGGAPWSERGALRGRSAPQHRVLRPPEALLRWPHGRCGDLGCSDRR